jgi:hypothetical protein
MVASEARLVGQEVIAITTINLEQFEKICDRVWNDRAAVISGRGRLSGEASLVRAVFWRLCNAGIKTNGCAEHDDSKPAILAYQLVVGRMLEVNARPPFDCTPILKRLIERYQNEVGNAALVESGL